MLYRVSGNLSDGRTFGSRIEATNPIEAIVTGRKALNESGVEDKDLTEIRARGVKGGKSIRFGTKREKKAAAPKGTASAPAAAAKHAAPTGGKK